MSNFLKTALLKAKQGQVARAISTTTVDQYNAMENSQKLLDVVVPFQEGEILYRQNRSDLLPCMATAISYNLSAFKSKVRGALGVATLGCSIDIIGFDIERDGVGVPLFKTENINGVDVEMPCLINKTEAGEPLEPKVLMTFRPSWGIDRTRNSWNQLRTEDMINLGPNRGVPRKNTKSDTLEDTKDTKKQQYQNEKIAWDLMPSLQPKIEKPMVNNIGELEVRELTTEQCLEAWENGEECDSTMLMAVFIANIPISKSAPSQKKASATQGDYKPLEMEAATEGIKDVFASKPEAEKAKAEPEAEKTEAEKTSGKKGRV